MFSFFRKPKPEAKPLRNVSSFFSTHAFERIEPVMLTADYLNGLKRAQPALVGVAMDDSSNGYPAFKGYGAGQNSMSEALAGWYASQGFIGHQMAGILAQHWLINKACSMPGDDAIRNGYRVTSYDGEDIPDEAHKIIKRFDKRFRVNWHLREFIRKGRIFGVRVAMFKVDSTDAQYYEKPFNIDGVTPGSYKGIIQIDPYWTAPMLDQAASSQPDSMHFYEPTWWLINGVKVHRSHLVIFRHADPVDILKPQYIYGGIPLPQQIMERVYAAERTANEAPQLAMTKRTNVWLTDMEKVMANAEQATDRLNLWAQYRDSYGIKLGDKESDEFQQFDTSLADFDALIMTQYQLVAAQASVPATKLIGTTPKGFNSTGEYEEASYHELLESIQTHDLTPFLERHHALVVRSFVAPLMLKMAGVETSVAWAPLDSPTAKEMADTNLVKAQIGAALIASGAISSEEERERVAKDRDGGYPEMRLGDGAPGIPEDDDGNDDDEGGQAVDGADPKAHPSGFAFDDRWITVHPNGQEGEGRKVLISGNGTVLAGMGGKFNGRNISQAHKGGTAEKPEHVKKSEHADNLSTTAASGDQHSDARAAHIEAAEAAQSAGEQERSSHHFARADVHFAAMKYARMNEASAAAHAASETANSSKEHGDAYDLHMHARDLAKEQGEGDLAAAHRQKAGEHEVAKYFASQRERQEGEKAAKEAQKQKNKELREKANENPANSRFKSAPVDHITNHFSTNYGLGFSNGSNAGKEYKAMMKEYKDKYWDMSDADRAALSDKMKEARQRSYAGHGASVGGHTEIDISDGSAAAKAMRKTLGHIDDAMAGLVSQGFDIKSELAKHSVRVVCGSTGKAMGHAWQDRKGFGNFAVSPSKSSNVEFMEQQKKYHEQRAANGKARWTVGGESEDAINRATAVHELAHALGMQSTKKSPERLAEILQRMHPDYTSRKQWIRDNVSEYATSNIKETDAEIAALVTSPGYQKGTLPAELEDHVDWLFNRKTS